MRYFKTLCTTSTSRHKRTLQKRINNTIALIIVLAILTGLTYLCFLINLFLAWICLGFSIAVVFNFPWYKFKK